MDLLKIHQVVLNCFEEKFTCLNDKGEIITVKGIPRKVYVRQISALQMTKVVRKGCQVFFVHIINNKHLNKEDKLKFDDIPFLQDFLDVSQKKFEDYPQREIWILLLSCT